MRWGRLKPPKKRRSLTVPARPTSASLPPALPDFRTPRAGLVQMRAYAQRHPADPWYPELQARLTRLADLREAIEGETYRLLVGELRYFG